MKRLKQVSEVRTKRILALCLLSACAHRVTPSPAPLARERVAGRAQWIDIQFAPVAYRHIGTDPLAGPWKILLSEAGHYCPVADSTYVMVQDGELYPCSWRVVRR